MAHLAVLAVKKGFDSLRFDYGFIDDVQPSTGHWSHPPLDQRYLPINDLYAGYAPRVNTTAGVKIEWRSHPGEHWTVGVTADGHLAGVLHPLYDLLLNLAPLV